MPRAKTKTVTPAEQKRPEERFEERSLTQEQRSQIIELLKSPDRPAYREIADRFGTSHSLVHRLHRQLEINTNAVAERRQMAYVRRLGRELPVSERVRLLAELARKPERGGEVQLRAIMRADELEGIVTAKERREGADNSGAVQPMFVLPPGSKIAVAVQTPGDANPSDTKAIEKGREQTFCKPDA